ncbi:hypothetical protein L596_005875 [Steinernema carpocapsae]|uniref:Uncharacterized protein n=1 Tax=Steinernema carpocapsae TaxID=34508 RepID=A0A4U8V0N0_STECR|nr:hypothetical protein L596_005875 [Steinernema carpocapsae]
MTILHRVVAGNNGSSISSPIFCTTRRPINALLPGGPTCDPVYPRSRPAGAFRSEKTAFVVDKARSVLPQRQSPPPRLKCAPYRKNDEPTTTDDARNSCKSRESCGSARTHSLSRAGLRSSCLHAVRSGAG